MITSVNDVIKNLDALDLVQLTISCIAIIIACVIGIFKEERALICWLLGTLIALIGNVSLWQIRISAVQSQQLSEAKTHADSLGQKINESRIKQEDTNKKADVNMLEEFLKMSKPSHVIYHGSTEDTFAALNRARITAFEVCTTKLSGQAPRIVNADGTWGQWRNNSPELKEWYTDIPAWLLKDSTRIFRRVVSLETPEMKAWNTNTLADANIVGRFEHRLLNQSARPVINVTIFDRNRVFITFSNSRTSNRYDDLRSIELVCPDAAVAIREGYFESLWNYSIK